jgi:hypothetical protein
MSRTSPLAWFALAALVACGADPSDEDTAPDTTDDTTAETSDTDPAGVDTDTTELTETDEADTDTSDTDAAGPVDTGAPRPADQVWNHVVQTMVALPSGQGFDLDGDGDVDNVLGGFAAAINPLIADNYGTTPDVAIVQTWGVLDGDAQADIGLFTARDTDFDLTDNFSGAETFEASVGLGPTGRALIHATTTMDGAGNYATALAAGQIALGPLVLPISIPVTIVGTSLETGHGGQLGGAVPTSALTNLLNQVGLGFLAGALGALADIDSDGNGTPDSISVAFSFTAVPCAVQIP